ncbi:integral membrane protein DUF6 [Geopyxis carbonaria]|nr:integral membrane protein DUF6 [Geopyxis carbonaria]
MSHILPDADPGVPVKPAAAPHSSSSPPPPKSLFASTAQLAVPDTDDRRPRRDSFSHASIRSQSPYPEFISPAPPAAPTTLTRCKTGLWANRGLLLILLSQFFGSLMSLTARLLETGFPGQHFHALQILFVRQSITCAGCLAWMWYNDIPDAPFGARKVRALLVARGLGGFWGVFGLYYSLTYLDLSDATVITFLAPIVASYACSVIPQLREPFTRAEAAAAGVSFAGVFLIARPTSLFSRGGGGELELPVESDAGAVVARGLDRTPPTATPHERLVAVGVALLGVLGAASAFTTIRWIGKRAHPLVSVFYFSCWCALVSFVCLLTVPSIGGIIWPSGLLQWGLLLGIGVSGFFMQFLLTSGLQLEKAGRGTNMVYSQMLFALFWERVVWGRSPAPLSIFGSMLILGSVLYVGLRKRVPEKVEVPVQVPDEEVGLVGDVDVDLEDEDEDDGEVRRN